VAHRNYPYLKRQKKNSSSSYYHHFIFCSFWSPCL